MRLLKQKERLSTISEVEGTPPTRAEQNEIIPELHSPPSKSSETLKQLAYFVESLKVYYAPQVVSRRLLREISKQLHEFTHPSD